MEKQLLSKNGYAICKKRILNEEELEKVYQITSSNMAEIGFEIREEDREIFKNSMRKNFEDENFVFFLLHKNENICGWLSLYIKPEGIFFSEIEFAPAEKGTRLLVRTLLHLLSQKEFERYENITFYINKKNKMSNKTFSHLGGKIVEEKPNGYVYLLPREVAMQALQKFDGWQDEISMLNYDWKLRL